MQKKDVIATIATGSEAEAIRSLYEAVLLLRGHLHDLGRFLIKGGSPFQGCGNSRRNCGTHLC